MKRLIIFLILIVLLSSISLAVPPWKQKQSEPTKIIVENRTIIVQNATQAEKGINWEAIGAIVGIVAAIAAFVGWLLTKKGRSITSKYLKEINSVFNEYRNDSSRCESELYNIKEKIERDFSKGKLSEESFSLLDSRIDKYLGEIRKGIITKFELSPKIRKELNEMLKDGIITEDEYKRFSKMNLKELSKEDREKLERLMKKWKEENK